MPENESKNQALNMCAIIMLYGRLESLFRHSKKTLDLVRNQLRQFGHLTPPHHPQLRPQSYRHQEQSAAP